MIKRRIIWILTHIALTYLIWIAINDGNINAQNLLKFLIWLVFSISLLALIGKKNVKGKNLKRAFPTWVDLFHTLGCAGFMAYHGWFLYAALFLMCEFFMIALYDIEF